MVSWPERVEDEGGEFAAAFVEEGPALAELLADVPALAAFYAKHEAAADAALAGDPLHE